MSLPVSTIHVDTKQSTIRHGKGGSNVTMKLMVLLILFQSMMSNHVSMVNGKAQVCTTSLDCPGVERCHDDGLCVCPYNGITFEGFLCAQVGITISMYLCKWMYCVRFH
jgi:hypothetical protein